MSEIKTPLKRCENYDGEGNAAFIIEPHHTIADVLRWCLDDLGGTELVYLARQVANEEFE